MVTRIWHIKASFPDWVTNWLQMVKKHRKNNSIKEIILSKNWLAERSFDLRTSGLWAQHASTAPLCCAQAYVLQHQYNAIKINHDAVWQAAYMVVA